MEPIKNLHELREYFNKLILNGLGQIKDRHTALNKLGQRIELTGWKAMRVVVVGSDEGIRCCTRADKIDGEQEIMLLRKDLRLIEGKMGRPMYDKVLSRCAIWLEKRELYPNREAITDKTNTFPEMQ